eukprot:475008-Rhodomonas_salina.1
MAMANTYPGTRGSYPGNPHASELRRCKPARNGYPGTCKLWHKLNGVDPGLQLRPIARKAAMFYDTQGLRSETCCNSGANLFVLAGRFLPPREAEQGGFGGVVPLLPMHFSVIHFGPGPSVTFIVFGSIAGPAFQYCGLSPTLPHFFTRY